MKKCVPPFPVESVSSVTSKPFGKTPEGEKVELYTLTNKNGAKVSLMTYGATVVDLWIPDRDGNLADITLGFDSFKKYPTESQYFGSTVGRFGNRINGGKFTLGGKVYQLKINEPPHQLHGGVKGFDKQIWAVEVLKSKQSAVRFTLRSPDGEEGFPGTLDVAVTYTLTDRNELKIAYKATTDKTTVINLTNHTYFNLAGGGTILNHQLKLHSSQFTPVSGELIPTGKIKNVKGTPLDFQKSTVIGSRLKEVGGDPIGYDHNFVLGKGFADRPKIAAEVYEPTSGRVMKVYTDLPGIQFYTGNFLDGTITGKGGKIKGKGGKIYNQHDGFCLETQHFPDSPNQPNFPSTVLKPGQIYKTTTVYKFATKS